MKISLMTMHYRDENAQQLYDSYYHIFNFLSKKAEVMIQLMIGHKSSSILSNFKTDSLRRESYRFSGYRDPTIQTDSHRSFYFYDGIMFVCPISRALF